MSHNSWVCALEPGSHNYRAHMPQLPKPKGPSADALQEEKPTQWEARAPQLESSLHLLQWEKSLHSSKEPAQPKQNKTKKKNIYIYIKFHVVKLFLDLVEAHTGFSGEIDTHCMQLSLSLCLQWSNSSNHLLTQPAGTQIKSPIGICQHDTDTCQTIWWSLTRMNARPWLCMKNPGAQGHVA